MKRPLVLNTTKKTAMQKSAVLSLVIVLSCCSSVLSVQMDYSHGLAKSEMHTGLTRPQGHTGKKGKSGCSGSSKMSGKKGKKSSNTAVDDDCDDFEPSNPLPYLSSKASPTPVPQHENNPSTHSPVMFAGSSINDRNSPPTSNLLPSHPGDSPSVPDTPPPPPTVPIQPRDSEIPPTVASALPVPSPTSTPSISSNYETSLPTSIWWWTPSGWVPDNEMPSTPSDDEPSVPTAVWWETPSGWVVEDENGGTIPATPSLFIPTTPPVTDDPPTAGASAPAWAPSDTVMTPTMEPTVPSAPTGTTSPAPITSSPTISAPKTSTPVTPVPTTVDPLSNLLRPTTPSPVITTPTPSVSPLFSSSTPNPLETQPPTSTQTLLDGMSTPTVGSPTTAEPTTELPTQFEAPVLDLSTASPTDVPTIHIPDTAHPSVAPSTHTQAPTKPDPVINGLAPDQDTAFTASPTITLTNSPTSFPTTRAPVPAPVDSGDKNDFVVDDYENAFMEKNVHTHPLFVKFEGDFDVEKNEGMITTIIQTHLADHLIKEIGHVLKDFNLIINFGVEPEETEYRKLESITSTENTVQTIARLVVNLSLGGYTDEVSSVDSDTATELIARAFRGQFRETIIKELLSRNLMIRTVLLLEGGENNGLQQEEGSDQEDKKGKTTSNTAVVASLISGACVCSLLAVALVANENKTNPARRKVKKKERSEKKSEPDVIGEIIPFEDHMAESKQKPHIWNDLEEYSEFSFTMKSEVTDFSYNKEIVSNLGIPVPDVTKKNQSGRMSEQNQMHDADVPNLHPLHKEDAPSIRTMSTTSPKGNHTVEMRMQDGPDMIAVAQMEPPSFSWSVDGGNLSPTSDRSGRFRHSRDSDNDRTPWISAREKDVRRLWENRPSRKHKEAKNAQNTDHVFLIPDDISDALESF